MFAHGSFCLDKYIHLQTKCSNFVCRFHHLQEQQQEQKEQLQQEQAQQQQLQEQLEQQVAELSELLKEQKSVNAHLMESFNAREDESLPMVGTHVAFHFPWDAFPMYF